MMTSPPSSASPSKFGGILFNRHALLLVLLATAQLIPSIQGFDCYDCAYPRGPLTTDAEKDYPCHKLNDKRPHTQMDCGGSDGCFSMHVSDHGTKEAWGFGSCLNPSKDSALECILSLPMANRSIPDGIWGQARKGHCGHTNLSPQEDYELRTKCLGEKDVKEPAPDAVDEIGYDLCPCGGALCRLPAYPGQPTPPPVAPPSPPTPAETTAPDVPGGSVTPNAAGLLQVLTIAGVVVVVGFWTRTTSSK